MIRKVNILVILTLVLGWSLTFAIAANPVLDPLRDLLVKAVTRLVSRSLNGSVEVGALRGSLLNAPILKKVVLRDRQGEVVGRVEEIRLRYDLKSLLQKRLSIQTIDVIQPTLTLRRELEGGLNLAGVFAPRSREKDPEPKKRSIRLGLPFDVVVDEARIEDGRVEIDLPALPGLRKLEGLRARFSAGIDSTGLTLNLQELTARATPADVSIQSATGQLRQLDGRLEIEGLRLQTDRTLLTLAGSLAMPNATKVNARAAPLDLGEIGRLLQQDALRGEVGLTLEAEGPAQNLLVQARLTAKQGKAELEGRFDMAATPMQHRSRLTLSHLDLSGLWRREALESDLNLTARLAGEGFSFPGFRGHAELFMDASRLGDIDLHPSQLNVEIQERRFLVQRLSLDTSALRAEASGVIDLAGTTRMNYRLSGDLAKLRRVMATEALRGAVEVEGEATGKGTAIETRGLLQATNLLYRQNRIDALRLNYEGTQLGGTPQVRGLLVMEGATMNTWPVERVELRASYDGGSGGAELEAEVRQSPTNVTKTKGSVTLTKNGADLKLDPFEIRLGELVWRAAPPVRVSLARNRFAIHRFRLFHQEESIELAGVLEGDRFEDVRLGASQVNLEVLGRFLPPMKTLRGSAGLRASLNGTLTEPILEGELTALPEGKALPPLRQLQATWTYGQRRLRAMLRVDQKESRGAALQLELPINLALAALPVDARLLEGPLALRLDLDRPSLTGLQGLHLPLPEMSGTLKGAVSVRGTYHSFEIDSDVELMQFGLKGWLERLSGPLQLKAALATAETTPALVRALRRGEVRPKVGRLELRAPALRGELQRTGRPGAPIRVEQLFVLGKGQWTAEGPEGTLDSLRLRAHAPGMPEAALLVEGRWTSRRVEVSRLGVRFPRSELTGSGQLDLRNRQIKFHLDLPRVALDEFLETFPARLPQETRGTVEVSGTLASPRITAQMEYARGALSADLSASFKERKPNYAATFRLKELDAGAIFPKATGGVNANLRMEGEGFSPKGRRAWIEVDMAGPALSLAPGFKGRLRAEVEGESIRLENLRFESDAATLVAQGGLSEGREVSFTYSLDIAGLKPLQDYFGFPLEAKGNLSGKMAGQLRAPEAQGTLRLAAWRYGRFHGGALRASMEAENLGASVRASLAAEVEHLTGPSLPDSSLKLNFKHQPGNAGFHIEVTRGHYRKSELVGNVALQGGQRLTLSRVRLQQGPLAWINESPVQITRDAGGALRVERLVLRSGDQEFRAQGSLFAEEPSRLKVSAAGIQVQTNLRAFAPALASDLPDGRLAFDFTLRGSLKSPQGEGTAELNSLQWRGHRLGDMQARVNLSGQVVRTVLLWRDGEQELLRLEGSFATSPAGPIALHLRASQVDLGKVPLPKRHVREGAGRLNLDLRLTGTWERPKANGHLEITDGRVQLVALGEPYRDIQARVVFEDERVNLEQLDLKSRTGNLDLKGWLESEGRALRRLDLRLQAEDFAALRTPTLEAALSGSLHLRGSPEEMTATGQLALPRGVFRLTGELGGGPKDVSPWELTVDGVYGPGLEAVKGKTGAVDRASKPPLPFLRTDLAVEFPRNVWLRGSGTAVEVGGKVRVTKQPDGPFLLAGTIETLRGFASFYTKRFRLERGKVTFTGGKEINPLLDVTATERVSNYVVSVHLEGRAKKPEVILRSKPELGQTDIVSLLVTGRTTDRLTNAEKTALSSQAQTIGGSVIAGQLEEILGKDSPLGLDTIEITGGKEPGTGRVAVGRYITQDIFLSFENQFGKEDVNQVNVEYSLTPQLKFRGSSSTLGDSAVDFLWRIDY